jgi:hypothetical protein
MRQATEQVATRARGWLRQPRGAGPATVKGGEMPAIHESITSKRIGTSARTAPAPKGTAGAGAA